MGVLDLLSRKFMGVLELLPWNYCQKLSWEFMGVLKLFWLRRFMSHLRGRERGREAPVP